MTTRTTVQTASLLDDDRTIARIVDEQGTIAAVSETGVEQIQAYREAGEMGYVPWFAVLCKGEIVQRVNGKYVAQVVYMPKEN